MLEASGAGGFNYTGHLGGGPVHVVVDHLVVRQPAGLADLVTPGLDAGRDLCGWIAALSQPPTLDLVGGREEQDHDRVRLLGDHLARALDIDFQENVTPLRRVRDRRAVAVTEELGPLQEPAVVDALGE
jgi:hypothetical protein